MSQQRGTSRRLSRPRGARTSGPGSFLALLVLSVVAAVSWWQNRPEQLEGRVLHVQDGDSFVMMKDGEEQVVRLFAIDCPEKGQPYGREARTFATDLLLDQPVNLKVRNTDRYGRLISTVYLEDGRCVNHELVGNGYAWWYRSHAKRDRTLARLEGAARSERRGLWEDRDPEAPWEYRNRNRNNRNGS